METLMCVLRLFKVLKCRIFKNATGFFSGSISVFASSCSVILRCDWVLTESRDAELVQWGGESKRLTSPCRQSPEGELLSCVFCNFRNIYSITPL